MIAEKFFLRLLFTVSFLVFCFYNTFAKESEQFTASYFSNKSGTGGFALNLINDDGTMLVVSYNSYLGGSVKVYLDLKSDREIYLKTIKLNENDVCMYDIFTLDRLMKMSNRDRMWGNGFDLNFHSCKPEWRELIKKAKGDLKFNVECVEAEGKLERKYTFKVSAANLSKLIDLIEQVHGFELLP
ncbi:hypothetical protein K9R62_04965 (plasmid) [Borrelia hermsii]|uniref:hypothetical protein n=1 Tax=Borrelia hermsii TaxID=140 RepID=UPI001CF4F6FB|nr:hypothetical protein [Borrelia hermsii]UCP01990.1 hypothetical protein K9R62_04965 [Borrelia hermsii]